MKNTSGKSIMHSDPECSAEWHSVLSGLSWGAYIFITGPNAGHWCSYLKKKKIRTKKDGVVNSQCSNRVFFGGQI